MMTAMRSHSRRCRGLNRTGENKGARCSNRQYFPTVWDALRLPLCAAHADPIWSCRDLRKGEPCLCPTRHEPPGVIESWKRPPWPKPLPLAEETRPCPGPECVGATRTFRLTKVTTDAAGEVLNIYTCLGCGTAPDGMSSIPVLATNDDGAEMDITLIPLTDDPAKLQRIAELSAALR